MTFDYREPTSIREAVELGARFGEDSLFLAGGTDLMIQIDRGRCAPRHVVSLHRVPGLDAIDVDGTIALGAPVTHRRLERSSAFSGCAARARRERGGHRGHQIRNVATIGGNVVNASPAADVVPVLLTLDAAVTCLGPDGERTLPFDGFASGPGVTARRPDELLTRVAFPRLPERSATAFLKAGRRRAMEISVVCVAARVTLDPSFERCEDVRIAPGAVAPTRSGRGRRSEASKAARSPRRRCERRDGSPPPSAGRSVTCAPRHATARCS